jgi:hypothetical protein
MVNKTPLCCARQNTGGFTRTMPLDELILSLQKLLPVDKLYTVFQSGTTYELLEVGTFVVDFKPSDPPFQSDEPPAVQIPQPAPSSSPSMPVDALGQPQITLYDGHPSLRQEVISPVILEALNPTDANGYSFQPATEKAKPQKEFAKTREKGIKRGKVKKSKGRAAKAKPAPSETDIVSDDPNDKSWLTGLPAPVRALSPGNMQVTNIRQATQAEADAASHFNGMK